jgi:hypothetical protein
LAKLDTFIGYAGTRAFPAKTWLGHFSATDQLLENGKAVYKDHYGLVKRSAPAEWFLNYELGSGWKPLCEFLGKEEREVEFPSAY